MSNVIVLCAVANGLLESDSQFAQVGRDNGWKISRYEDPEQVPVRDLSQGTWWLLQDDGSRQVTALESSPAGVW
jgi:hypothetical protein